MILYTIKSMKKSVTAKQVVQKIKDSKSDRVKTSLYLSQKVYNEFKMAANKEDLSPSEVIEELMVLFTKGIRLKKL